MFLGPVLTSLAVEVLAGQCTPDQIQNLLSHSRGEQTDYPQSINYKNSRKVFIYLALDWQILLSSIINLLSILLPGASVSFGLEDATNQNLTFLACTGIDVCNHCARAGCRI